SRGASGSKFLTRCNTALAQATNILSESFLDSAGQSEAGVYTVQFQVVPVSGSVPDTGTGGVDVNPTRTRATVNWAIGGNTVQRILSVSNGASLTGVGAG